MLVENSSYVCIVVGINSAVVRECLTFSICICFAKRLVAGSCALFLKRSYLREIGYRRDLLNLDF